LIRYLFIDAPVSLAKRVPQQRGLKGLFQRRELLMFVLAKRVPQQRGLKV